MSQIRIVKLEHANEEMCELSHTGGGVGKYARVGLDVLFAHDFVVTTIAASPTPTATYFMIALDRKSRAQVIAEKLSSDEDW